MVLNSIKEICEGLGSRGLWLEHWWLKPVALGGSSYNYEVLRLESLRTLSYSLRTLLIDLVIYFQATLSIRVLTMKNMTPLKLVKKGLRNDTKDKNLARCELEKT